MPSRREHWEGVYETKHETSVSWFQPVPRLSLDLIAAYEPEKSAPIIDIGGGASHLTAELLRQSYRDLTVLDISSAALDRAKENIGPGAEKISWIAADITAWEPPRHWSLWHDRAVFHFLTDAASQDAYIRALKDATENGAIAIISGFAPDGPEKCSGLPVMRYDAKSLSKRVGEDFKLIGEKSEEHKTPGGAVQKFYYAVLQRR